MIDAALAYRNRDMSVIPLDGKRPLISWKPFQESCASNDQVEAWGERFPGMNVGVVTGRISGLVVIDADSAEATAKLEAMDIPATPTVLTSRGRHYYFAHPETPISNRAGLSPGVDMRGDGGYVVAPPSIHPNTGAVYEWLPGRSLDDVTLARLPDWVCKSQSNTRQSPAGNYLRFSALGNERMWAFLEGSQTGQVQTATLSIPRGERNTTLFSLAGKMRKVGYLAPELREDIHRINNLCCKPPLPRQEISSLTSSVLRYPRGDVRSQLRWLRLCVIRAAIKRRTALTLRNVLLAHIDVACRFNRCSHSASARQIAELASVNKDTVIRRWADLVAAGILERQLCGGGTRGTLWRITDQARAQLRTFTKPSEVDGW
jgi:hypothetical protein